MPVIHIEWFEGRTPEQKRELAQALTQEIVRIGKCKVEEVDIIFEDVRRQDWATGGKLNADP
jgi:4-oxalocrotonate tautomerase